MMAESSSVTPGECRLPWWYSGTCRLISFSGAGALGLLLSLYPQAVMPAGRSPDHIALSVCLWGIAAGFVHGVGFVPRNGVARLALGPFIAWSLMPLGMLWLTGAP